MKKFIVFLLSLVLVAALSSCGKRKEKKKAADEVRIEKEAMQKSFEANLVSYESSIQSFIGNSSSLKEGTYALVRIPEGSKVEYSLNGKEYQGVLAKPLFVLRKEGRYFLKNGAEITNDEHLSLTWELFNVKPFPVEWGYKDLLPYIEKYELTAVLKHDWGDVLIQNLEEYFEYACCEDSLFISPGPKFIVSFKDDFILVGQDGKKWLTREQSMSRRKAEAETAEVNKRIMQGLELMELALES
ncbi:hypothetical protein B6U91_01410 [Candidatus Pacearchaeota archaeon ex4484_71]|nr:MAG: hypothetical protein B6U91_01410 [Candidatus Pacearchaeota archaeon ex4484_71]